MPSKSMVMAANIYIFPALEVLRGSFILQMFFKNINKNLPDAPEQVATGIPSL